MDPKHDTLKIDKAVRRSALFILLSILLALATVSVLLATNQRLSDLRDHQLYAYRLKENLCALSDKSCQSARSFAATLDPQYETAFYQLMVAENHTCNSKHSTGETYRLSPEPRGQTELSYDCLKHLLQEQPDDSQFLVSELEILCRALDHMEQVTAIELKAIQLAKNAQAQEDTATYQRRALSILFDSTYQQARNEFVTPILQFADQVDTRVLQEMETHKHVAAGLSGLMLTAFSASIVFNIRLVYLRHKNGLARIRQLKATVAEQTEKLTESLHAKEKLFSVIAHDLRGPLGSAQILTEDLLLNLDDLERKEAEETVHLVNETLLSTCELTENLLMWSRTQANAPSLRMEELTLSKILPHAIAPQICMAERKEIAVQMDFNPNTKVFANKEGLELILRNLMSNAVKFTPRGGHIKVAARHEENTAIIEVRDDGVGISADHLRDLFKSGASYHCEGTEHESSSGVGLGLAAEFAKSFDAHLSVESKEDVGTTFFIRVPRKSKVPAQSEHPEGPA